MNSGNKNEKTYINSKGNYGHAPSQVATENSHIGVTKAPPEIVGFLLKKDVKNPSQMVAKNSRIGVTKAPLINTKGNYGQNPLQIAAENSYIGVTKAPLINTKGNYGQTQTPLQQSVDKVRGEIVGFLEGMDETSSVDEIRNKVAEFLATKGTKVNWPATQVDNTQTAQAEASQSK